MAPCLPPELYRGIFENLNPRDDIKTLLSTSLASRALAEEIQRILFQAGPLSLQEHKARNEMITYDTITNAYIAFLEAILGRKCNRSLAVYIQSFEHYCLKESEKLIDLVTRALPLMKNLKFLSIDLSNSKYSMNIMEALCNCEFQLHSLKLVVTDRTPQQLYKFLHCQQSLAHLNILDYHWRMAGGILPSVEGILPALTSLQTNNMMLWLWLEHTRNITALCLSGPSTYIPLLINVRYVRLIDTMPGHLTHAILPCTRFITEVLDIDDKMFLVNGLSNLADHMPHLRILIQRGWKDEDIPQSIMKNEAVTAFERFPDLRYFIVSNKFNPKGAFLYCRKFGDDILKYGACAFEEHDFEFDTRYVSAVTESADWWMRWADILSNEKMLGIS